MGQLINITTLLIAVFLTFTVRAEVTELSNKGLCELIAKGEEGVKQLPADFIRLRDSWRFFGAKKTWAEPTINELKIKSLTTTENKKTEIKHFSQFKNYIFGMTQNLDSPEQLTLLNQYTTDMKRLENLEKKLKKVFFTKVFDRCLRKAKAINFSYPEYLSLLDKLRPYQQLRTLLFSKQIVSSVETIVPTLRLRYDINLKATWAQIFKALKAPTTANVIIILPSDEEGRIRDNNGIFLPDNFFESIGPGVLSIGLYTDKWRQSEKYYQFKSILENNDSFFSKRFWLTPKKMAFEGEETLRPYQGLAHYITNFDKSIHKEFRKMREIKVPEIFSPLACALSFQGLESQKGDFIIELNQHFLSPLVSGEKIEHISFPCSHLKTKQNLVEVKAISTGTHQLINHDYEAVLELNDGKKLLPESVKHDISQQGPTKNYQQGRFFYK